MAAPPPPRLPGESSEEYRRKLIRSAIRQGFLPPGAEDWTPEQVSAGMDRAVRRSGIILLVVIIGLIALIVYGISSL